MAVRENEMLRHELTFKTHQCDQFKASANAMSEQCRLAVQKLENIAPLVRSLSSTTGQLGNMVSSSSNASSAANNNENEVHNKLSQTLDRLVEILNGFDGRVQLSGRSQQQVPSASMPQLPSPSGIGDRMVNVNNGLSRSQDYPDISRSKYEFILMYYSMQILHVFYVFFKKNNFLLFNDSRLQYLFKSTLTIAIEYNGM